MLNFSLEELFSNITITDITALIGCITGCVSLAINLRKLWTERFSLKIHFFRKDNLYFEKLKYSSCITELQGLLHVRFENRSSLPLTIHTILIFIDGSKVSFKKFNNPPLKLTTIFKPDGGERWIEYSMDKQISEPLRLEAYDAYDGYLFLPHYPSTSKTSQVVRMRLETTKGKKTRFSKIHLLKPIYEYGK